MPALRLGRHPLHPALVHFPIAAWTAGLVLNAAYLLTGDLVFWHSASWSTAVGVATALAAMAAGFLDLVAIPSLHPARATAQRHMLLMGSSWCLYVGDLLVRPLGGAPSAGQAWLCFGLSIAGFVLLAVGAYAGARLVYDFGIGQTGVGATRSEPSRGSTPRRSNR